MSIQFPDEHNPISNGLVWIQHIIRLSREFGVDFEGCESSTRMVTPGKPSCCIPPFELSVFRKQPLYLYEVVVRSTHFILPKPTCGISQGTLLLLMMMLLKEKAIELSLTIDGNKLENKFNKHVQKNQKRKWLIELKSLELDTNFMSYVSLSSKSMTYGSRSKEEFWLLKIDQVKHSLMECEGA